MADDPKIETVESEATPEASRARTSCLSCRLQNTTLFPETVVPLAVGRDRSTRAVESSLATEEKLLACITTKTENVTGDDAKSDDLYKIGTIVNVKRMMRNEGVMQLIVQGMDRFESSSGRRSSRISKQRSKYCPIFAASMTKRSRRSNETFRE